MPDTVQAKGTVSSVTKLAAIVCIQNVKIRSNINRWLMPKAGELG
jgi:hypothetical protein